MSALWWQGPCADVPFAHGTGSGVYPGRGRERQAVQTADRAPQGAQQRPASGRQHVEEEAHGPHDGGAPAALRLLQHRREAGTPERH